MLICLHHVIYMYMSKQGHGNQWAYLTDVMWIVEIILCLILGNEENSNYLSKEKKNHCPFKHQMMS